MKPLIIVNYKTYQESSGKNAISLTLKLHQISKKLKDYSLAIAPQVVDLKDISKKNGVLLLAQAMDSITYGANTGKILPESIKESGAKGTLINHSENPLPDEEIKKQTEICRRLKLLSVVCAFNLTSLRTVLSFKPDYVAYEPKELIGGNVSVTSAKGHTIREAIQLAKEKKVKLLLGAGVHSLNDIKEAVKLGADGVLISHALVKASNPERFFRI